MYVHNYIPFVYSLMVVLGLSFRKAELQLNGDHSAKSIANAAELEGLDVSLNEETVFSRAIIKSIGGETTPGVISAASKIVSQAH
ncbi:MAG: hypothetical protein CML30_09705 [Rhizobiales bacterium]|nr:hypothetical protein [Hyphomicrobiales bacterium]